MIADFWLDLGFALRSLRLRPAFSAMIILSLGLGIAANVAIFSLVNATLLRPIAAHAPEELALFAPGWSTGRPRGMGSKWIAVDGRMVLFSHPMYKRLREQTKGLLIAAQDSALVTVNLRAKGTSAANGEIAKGRCVSANFFEVLGVEAQYGRTFEATDDRAQGASPNIVLNYRFWQRRFSSDPKAIGNELNIDGTLYTVVGVMPPGFRGASVGNRADFWVPIGMANTFIRSAMGINDHALFWLQPFGRLTPGTTIRTAEASADVVLNRYAAEADGFGEPEPHPHAGAGPVDRRRAGLRKLRIELQSGETGFSSVRHGFRDSLLVLMVGVGLLLLIVCLNVSHLLLARAMKRRHEMTVRAALGATRGRLVRQLLTEGFLLATLGAAAGALGTRWLSNGLVALASAGSGTFDFSLEVATDERVLAFSAALALGTALLLGMVPVGYSLSRDLQQSMRASSQSVSSGGSRHWLTRTIMVSQVAFSLVLLVSAGLLARNLSNLRQLKTGFDEAHVMLADIDVSKAEVSEARARFLYEDIPRRIAALPGVTATSLSTPPILGWRLGWSISFPGTDRPITNFPFYRVTRDYFDTLGIGLVRGRGFSESDNREAARVAVVNEQMAAKEFGGRAIGRSIQLDMVHDVEVVGVVSNARTRDIRLPLESLFYLPMSQPHGLPAKLPPVSLEVRGQGDRSQLIALMRQAVADAQTGLALGDVRSLNEQRERTLVPEHLLAVLAGTFGLAALVLVAVGLYGIMAQWATQRTREMGIRLALGATPHAVQWLVLREALALLAIGLLIGTAASLLVSRLLHSLLFEAESLNVQALLGSLFTLTTVATLAAYLPAHRVSCVDPVTALHAE